MDRVIFLGGPYNGRVETRGARGPRMSFPHLEDTRAYYSAHRNPPAPFADMRTDDYYFGRPIYGIDGEGAVIPATYNRLWTEAEVYEELARVGIRTLLGGKESESDRTHRW